MVDAIMKEYDLESDGLSLLEFAEQWFGYERDPESKCTYEQIIDPTNKRVDKCSSSDSCYDSGSEQYVNEKCDNEYESCAKIILEDANYGNCLLTRYCGASKDDYVFGPNRRALKEDITCPGGNKETELEMIRIKESFATDN